MNVPSGYTALDLIGFTDKGDYSSSATYVKNDLVHHNNSIWRCLVDDTIAVTPAEGANWTVYIQNGTTLNGMADVNLTTPANGDLLRYNSTSSKWENQDVDSTPTQSSTKLVQSGGVYTQLANKANTADLATVATTGAYSDLSGTPSLAAVATSGAYSDLTGQPTIPTVNDATLTIQKNGTNVATFTANSSTDQTANISVPTKTSDLNNDSNFVSDANYQHITVDSAMSSSSANPVQNQVIYGELSDVKQALSNKVDMDLLGEVGAINYLNNKAVTTEKSGVTFTVNDDKTVTANGTCTGTSASVFELGYQSLKKGTYRFSGCPSGASNTSFVLQLYLPNSEFALDYGDGAVFTLDEDTSCRCNIYMQNGYTFNNKIFKPMIAPVSYTGPYVPYAMTNKELTQEKFSYKDNGVLGAKNLFELDFQSQTINDLTFTVNSDKSITVNGTASALTQAYINSASVSFKNTGSFMIKGCPQGGGLSTYDLRIGNAGIDGSADAVDTGEGALFSKSDGSTAGRVIITIRKDYVANNLTFKPMITLPSDTDPTYQPYAMTNKELTKLFTVESGTTSNAKVTWKRFGKIVFVTVDAYVGTGSRETFTGLPTAVAYGNAVLIKSGSTDAVGVIESTGTINAPVNVNVYGSLVYMTN